MRRLGRFVFLTAALAVAARGEPPAAAASGGYLGGLVVTTAQGAKQITGGDETTLFQLILPADARCPGDSAHDQWRINGYIIPASESIETTYIDGSGPSPIMDADTVAHRMPLYAGGRPLHWKYLVSNDRAGLPGRIPAFPPFSMDDAVRLHLAPGSYVMGLGCDISAKVTRYWQVPVEIVRPDGPKGTTLRWSVPLDKQTGVALRAKSDSSVAPIVAGVVVVIAAGLTAVVAVGRRRVRKQAAR